MPQLTKRANRYARTDGTTKIIVKPRFYKEKCYDKYATLKSFIIKLQG